MPIKTFDSNLVLLPPGGVSCVSYIGCLLYELDFTAKELQEKSITAVQNTVVNLTAVQKVKSDLTAFYKRCK